VEQTDEAVEQVFDALVLSGQLKPFLPGWWELLSPEQSSCASNRFAMWGNAEMSETWHEPV
jgi:hypothetical protein